MSQASDIPHDQRTYFIDAENAAEMARLVRQDRLITREMGGLFPEQSDLSRIHDILDLACGPGGWVRDVAHAYPDMQVVGIDSSELMVAYGGMMAANKGIPNARFQVMNALTPLAFPDHRFDLVNARLIVGFMPADAWPRLLRECRRITRPGGIIRLTEGDVWGLTTSPTIEHLSVLFSRALQRAGYSFSPDGRTAGITPVLSRLLREAGYHRIQKQAHVIDYSAGEPAHGEFYQNFLTAFTLMQPFLITLGLITQEDMHGLYRRALEEMQEDDFCGLWYFLTVWGSAPA